MTIEPSPDGPAFALRDDAPAMGGIVDRVATRMSEREIAVALDLGHVGAFNQNATAKRLSVANAHVWQETGRGKYVWNYCLVNLDWLPGDTGDRFPLVADEGHGANTHSMRKFLRSFPDPYSGAVAYWRTMAGRYGAALPFFDRGDGDGAGRKLKELRFYTGDVEIYAPALKSMAAEFLRRSGKGL